MPELHDLLAAEASHREPPARPPFDALLRRHRHRTWRHRSLGGVAAAAVLATVGATLPGVLSPAGPPVKNPGSQPPPVHIVGQLVEVGGPPPGAPRGVPGTVRFTGDGRPVTVTTNPQGQFSVELEPGTYTVTGTSPLYEDGNAFCYGDNPLRVPVFAPVPRSGPGIQVTVTCQLR